MRTAPILMKPSRVRLRSGLPVSTANSSFRDPAENPPRGILAHCQTQAAGDEGVRGRRTEEEEEDAAGRGKIKYSEMRQCGCEATKSSSFVVTGSQATDTCHSLHGLSPLGLGPRQSVLRPSGSVWGPFARWTVQK